MVLYSIFKASSIVSSNSLILFPSLPPSLTSFPTSHFWSSLSSPFPLLVFLPPSFLYKDPCDYIGPTQIIQDLLHLRLLHLITLQSPFCYVKKNSHRGSGRIGDLSIHRRNKTKFFIFFSGFHSPDYPAPTISSYNEFASQQLRNVFYSEAASVVLYLTISFLQYINEYTLLQDVIIMRLPSIRLLSVRYAKNARP